MQELIEAAKRIDREATALHNTHPKSVWDHGKVAGLFQALEWIEAALSNAETHPALKAAGGWRASREEVLDAIAAAYELGCHDVHENYRSDPDPSFTEAARDYADEAILALGAVPEGGEESPAKALMP